MPRDTNILPDYLEFYFAGENFALKCDVRILMRDHCVDFVLYLRCEALLEDLTLVYDIHGGQISGLLA